MRRCRFLLLRLEIDSQSQYPETAGREVNRYFLCTFHPLLTSVICTTDHSKHTLTEFSSKLNHIKDLLPVLV